MPTWSGVLNELMKSGTPPHFDEVRRQYLAATAKYTKRNVILYATKWTQPDPNIQPTLVSIVDEDLQGIMEVGHGLDGKAGLDLILHSPGGSPEATEVLVNYLRSKFGYIRVIVPHLAMSAATMVACAANVILMGKHSFLGPIDPQLFIGGTPLGPRMVPAQAILEQFDQAIRECQDPKKLPAWLPMLGQYGPDLLVQCEHACDMAKELVANWLKKYMLKDEKNRDEKAEKIANWLSDHKQFKTHSRHIPRDVLMEQGLRIDRLESDETAQDLFLSVFHAAAHTFNGTGAVKIIENHLGKAFIKVHIQVIPQPPPPSNPPKANPPSAPSTK